MITDPFKRFARTGLTAHDGSYSPLLDVIDEDPSVVRAEHRFRRRGLAAVTYSDGTRDEFCAQMDVLADLAAARMDSAAPGCEGPDAA